MSDKQPQQLNYQSCIFIWILLSNNAPFIKWLINHLLMLISDISNYEEHNLGC